MKRKGTPYWSYFLQFQVSVEDIRVLKYRRLGKNKNLIMI